MIPAMTQNRAAGAALLEIVINPGLALNAIATHGKDMTINILS
jgi:hypothetical protein